MEIVLKILMFNGGLVGLFEIISRNTTLPVIPLFIGSLIVWANFHFSTSYNVLLNQSLNLDTSQLIFGHSAMGHVHITTYITTFLQLSVKI